MNTIYPALTMCIALAFCAPSVKYVSLPGYAFKTDPKCQRTVAKTKFDSRCDWPRLGIKDYTPPPVMVIGI